MLNLQNYQISQTLFGPWNTNQQLSKIFGKKEDQREYNIREFSCRAIQMGIYAATAYKLSQLVIPLMTTLKPEVVHVRTLMHRMIIALPYFGYFVGLLRNKDTSKMHQLALAIMVVHSVAISYLGRPLVGLLALFAFLETPLLLRKKDTEEISPFDQLDSNNNNILHVVAKEGKGESLQLVMEAFKKEPEEKRTKLLEAFNKQMLTPLHLANTAEAAQLLLDNGADPFLRSGDLNGDTPLIHAVRRSCLEVIDPLLKKEPRVDQVNNHGETALHVAIANGKEAALDKLLLNKTIDLSITDKNLCNYLILAIKRGWPIAKMLIDQGMYISNPDDVKDVVLFYVCNGLVERVRYFIKAGVLVTQDMVNQAVWHNQPKMLKILLDDSPAFSANDKATELYESAKEKNHEKIMKAFAEKNPFIGKRRNSFFGLYKDIDTGDEKTSGDFAEGLGEENFKSRGWPAIVISAYLGNLDKVKACIENGDPVDQTISKEMCAKGVTSLIAAANRGHIDVVKFLIKQGAKVNHEAEDGWTALMFAAKYGMKEIAEVLLEADEVENNVNKKAAFRLAKQRGHAETVKLLIQNGADLDLI